MNFSNCFSTLQEEPWYRKFLDPIIDILDEGSDVLDIGTGSGKLLQLVYNEKHITGVGIDTNEAMLKEAKIKLINTPIQLHKIDPDQDYPFEFEKFDDITICNVLFNLKHKDAIDRVLNNALKLLKTKGRIFVLTPTGKGGLIKLLKNYYSFKNKGICLWYLATKRRAIKWSQDKYLMSYCRRKGLIYDTAIHLNGYARTEILKINNHTKLN